jgi:hypothetical protein
MFSTARFRPAVLVAAAAICAAPIEAQVAADAALFRVFLRDGSAIVSYGEFARVADRVVVSLPLGGTVESPALHLVSIPADRVDWEKTDAYADSVRSTRYAATRGPDDFALLSEAVNRALTDIALETDPNRKVAMAAEARQNVMKWVSEHYGYRAEDAARMAGLFDQVVSEVRAASGLPTFELALIASTAAPPSVPLLPLPSDRESVEQALRAVELAPDATERVSLLQAIQAVISGSPAGEGKPAWTPALRARVSAALSLEERASRAYDTLTRGAVRDAERYARVGNVGGVESVIRRALSADDGLGQRRPHEMAALLATLDVSLDQARRIRLARDNFEARAGLLRQFRASLEEPLRLMRAARAPLDEIRRLAGPTQPRLARLAASIAAAMAAMKGAAAQDVPAEAAAAHSLLQTAIHLASQAAETRRRAVLSKEMKPAWEASSAAAGALLLLDRATEELQGLMAAGAGKS